jgi:Transposase DDE domain
VPLNQVLSALVYHVMNAAGTLAEHFGQLFEDSLADSSLSERRTRLPWEVFGELLRLGLRPLAQAATQAEAFWRGWRLVALDGTQFSLTNTPQIKATTRKAKSRRGRAAFAKITTGVLLELGLHNPLAAAIGRGGQSEWALALELLAQLPAQALLLADRLHGCAPFIAAAQAACQRVGSHFLIRARANLRVQILKRFKDGSRLVRVPVRQKGNPRLITQWLELREIRVRVQRPGHRAQELRLWTSLLDPQNAPAQELIELYARRWEHELYFRELKHPLRKSEVLQSHTLETAAQEIAAVVLASALLARERARAAAGQTPVLRVSFIKTLELLRPLWLTLALGGDLLTARQQQLLTERFLERASRYVTRQRRRPRSCPRAVRQPVSGWPRLRQNQSWEGPLHFKLL